MGRAYRLGLMASLAAVAACADGPTNVVAKPSDGLRAVGGSKSYILLATGNTLPVNLAASVAAIGGSLVSTVPQIGMATATSDDPGFAVNAVKLSGIGSVGDDPTIQLDPTEQVLDAGVADGETIPFANPVGSTETFRNAQWAPDAVNAPAAWAAGQLGQGARVAILDTGINPSHVDIAANIDVAHSTSFVPGFSFNQDVGTFWHGMHVAAIVAGPDNGIGIIGIAPQATIISVKVLHNGSGLFSWMIQGMIYAATPIAAGGAGANIINMSLGGGFLKQGVGAAQLTSAITRAANYATQQGTLVVAAAGNSGVDLDHTANVVFYPAQAANVVSVSATGPVGWATGAAFNLDRPASYTNFGLSAIDLAGPGGDFALPGNAVCSKPRIPSGSVVAPCWVFDMVISAASGTSSYAWAAGTSMASPAVAGVAALIVGKFGPMQPQQIIAKLQQSADDLGKPGSDPFYGGGRVNAGRAIQ